MRQYDHDNDAVVRGSAAARSWRSALALSTCLSAAACGLPEPPDVRAQWGKNIQQLGGLTAVYPPSEAMRIGQLWIADASAASDEKRSGVKPRHLISMRLSDGVANQMELARQKQFVIDKRFVKSPDKLAEDLGLKTGMGIFRQPSDDKLEIVGFPAMTLLSFDQAALAGSAPTPFASFFAAFNTTQSKNLTVEALAVTVAELPVDEFGRVVQTACRDSNSVFGPGPSRHWVQAAGFDQMQAWYNKRQADAGKTLLAAFKPQILLIRRVYYMRGINYVYHDTNATAGAFSAAFNPRFPTGTTPPSAPTPPTNTVAPAVATLPQLAADMKQAIADIATIKTNIVANNNVNVGASFARATARGVEMTELFDRPLAFGYDALVSEKVVVDAARQVTGGIADLCDTFP